MERDIRWRFTANTPDEAAKIAAHWRWHVRRDEFSPDCVMCVARQEVIDAADLDESPRRVMARANAAARNALLNQRLLVGTENE